MDVLSRILAHHKKKCKGFEIKVRNDTRYLNIRALPVHLLSARQTSVRTPLSFENTARNFSFAVFSSHHRAFNHGSKDASQK